MPFLPVRAWDRALGAIVLSLICSLGCFTGTAVAAPPKPKTSSAGSEPRPPFSQSSAELLALRCPRAPAGLDVEVVFEETRLRYDEQGRMTSEYHSIYRVLTEQGADSWGGIAASYHPWHQNKPSVRARVTTREGASFELDEKTLVDALASQNGGNVYSDTRRVAGPLPAVRAGAVVETLISVSQHKPMFGAGSVRREFFYASTYTAESRVSVDLPSALGAKIVKHGAVPAEQVKKQGARELHTFVARDLLPLSEWPAALDPQLSPVPFLEVASARSWNAVASEYAAAVDAALAKFDAKPLVQTALAGESDRTRKLQKLLAFLHAQVRYTGLELGERSILPAPPGETLARHYGDCKDKSTLLVGLLRAAGFDAHVALLNSGNGLDVSSDAPGFGGFDHAIVHVAGSPALFIDPTDPYSAIGDLPYGDQDRLSLIASSQSKALLRTPRTSAELSRYEEEVQVEYPQLGKSKVREVTRARGSLQAETRASFDGDEAQLKEHLKSYVGKRFQATLVKAQSSGAADVSVPFELVLEANESERFQTYDDGGFVQAGPLGLYRFLPEVLFETPDEKLSDNERKEKRDAKDPRYREPAPQGVYIAKAHHNSVRYRLKAPLGFVWQAAPQNLTMAAEGIRVSRTSSLPSSEELLVGFDVQTNTRLIPQARVEAVRKLLHEFGQQATSNLRFVHIAGEAVTQHRIQEALRAHKELLAALPKDVAVSSRYARDLNRMHFGLAARQVVDKLVKEQPNSARAHWARGYVYLFDLAGRDSYPGADFVEAERSLRKALALDPEEPLYYRALAGLRHRSALRTYPRDPAKLDELVGWYRTLRTKFAEHEGDIELLRTLMWQGKFREIVQLAEEVEASDERNGMWVGAVAALEGANAARQKAEQLAGDKVRHTLGAGLGVLMIMGHYAPAQQIAELPMLNGETDAFRRLLGAVMRRDQCIKELTPAARAVHTWLTPRLQSVERLEGLHDELANLPEEKIDGHSLEQEINQLLKRINIFGDNTRTVAGRFVLDAAPCSSRWQTEERAGAVRVKLLPPGQPDDAEAETFYLRRNKSGYDLIGARVKGRTYPYSRAALLALDAKKLDEARVWLTWARELIEPRGGLKDKLDFYDTVKALWPADLASAGSDELSLLAAALGAGSGIPRVIAILQAGVKRPQLAPEKLRALRYLAAIAVDVRNPTMTAELLSPLRSEFPADQGLWQRQIRMLSAAQQHEELKRELDSYDARYPNEHMTEMFRNEIGRRQGRYAAVLEQTIARASNNQTTKSELNNVAWNALFAPVPLAPALKLAQLACEPREEADLSSLHTLATLYAEAGQVDQAFLYLDQIIASAPRTMPSHNWYTVGRLAETLHMPDVAKDAYLRVEKPELVLDTSTYLLAQKALTRLREGAAPRR